MADPVSMGAMLATGGSLAVQVFKWCADNHKEIQDCGAQIVRYVDEAKDKKMFEHIEFKEQAFKHTGVSARYLCKSVIKVKDLITQFITKYESKVPGSNVELEVRAGLGGLDMVDSEEDVLEGEHENEIVYIKYHNGKGAGAHGFIAWAKNADEADKWDLLVNVHFCNFTCSKKVRDTIRAWIGMKRAISDEDLTNAVKIRLITKCIDHFRKVGLYQRPDQLKTLHWEHLPDAEKTKLASENTKAFDEAKQVTA